MFVKLFCAITFVVNSVNAAQLFVRLSAGVPTEPVASNRIREVTLHLHELNDTIVSKGVVVLLSKQHHEHVDNGNHQTWHLNSSLTDKTDTFSGRIFTGLKYKATNFRDKPPTGACLGYHVQLELNGIILSNNCLKVHPRWMGERLFEQPSFGLLPLTSLAVPGTHNAGSFKTYNERDDMDELYRDCQEEDTYTQLVYGSRYLDLRPGVSYINKVKGTVEFWIFHWILQTENRLQDVLLDVKRQKTTILEAIFTRHDWVLLGECIFRFLDENPSEVVFIDFHEFPYLFDHYEQLEQLVERCLEPYVFQGVASETQLLDVVASNKRAIVSFAEDAQLADKYLPGVQHIWADTDVVQDLKNFIERLQMDKHFSGRRFLYSAMAELTPKGWGIVTDRYDGGIRALAHRHNLDISSWWVTDHSYRDSTNIVAVDYLMSSDIVEACISINAERASQKALED